MSFAQRLEGRLCNRGRFRNLVVTINARDFLDEVHFELDIEAMTRRDDVPSAAIFGNAETQLVQDLDDPGVIDLDAQQSRQVIASQLD